jgi:hypothetical protein
MSVTLRIHFAGLCIITPDLEPSPEVGPPCVHVLMPEHGAMTIAKRSGTTASSSDRHHARLLFMRANAVGKVTEDIRCVDLDAMSLDVLELTPTGYALPALNATISPLVANIADVGGVDGLEYVDRSYVDPTPTKPAKLQARVTLRAGYGEAHISDKAPYWTNEYDAPRRPWQGEMATGLTWHIEGFAEDVRLALRLRKLDGGALARTIHLQSDGDFIDVMVFNAIDDDFPPYRHRPAVTRGRGYSADHYEGFYALFPRAERTVVPKLVQPFPVEERRASGGTSSCKPAPSTANVAAEIYSPRTPYTPFTDTCSPSRSNAQPYTQTAASRD